MKEKNGFIATSVLYAFLVAFLTLFLGFMASYIQNKQLMNRIEDMAREDLEKYGNVQISDLKLGDYVVLDTIYDEGITDPPMATYTAPINPDTRWILFKINDTVEEDGSTSTIYSFVSNADAQKNKWLATTSPYSEDGTLKSGTLEPEMKYSNLRTLSELMHSNTYYDNTSKKYQNFDSSISTIRNGDFTKYFSYQFMYYINGGINVRFLTYDDVKEISSIRNERIQNAIFDQQMNYTIWVDNVEAEFDPTIVSGFSRYGDDGFYTISYSSFTKDQNVSTNELFNNACINRNLYKHAYGDVTPTGNGFYDYCYYFDKYLGSCYINGKIHGGCISSYAYNPRYVATIKVTKNVSGYVDSGNGTFALPYLITKGVK